MRDQPGRSMSSQNEKSSPLFDPAIAILIFGLIAAAIGWAAWHYYHGQISAFVLWFKYPQAYLLAWINPERYQIYVDYSLYQNPQELTGEKLLQFVTGLSAVFRWPMIMAVMGLSGWCFMRPLDRQFRRRLSLDGLITELARVFPTVLPAVVENPLTDKSGRWARPLKARDWLKKRKVSCVGDKQRPEWEPARQAFVEDLGEPWRGVMGLPPHLRVLVAGFSLKARRKRAEYEYLMNSMSEIWAKIGYKKGMDYGLNANKKVLEYADTVLAHPKFGGAADIIAIKHAYANSAICELLEWGRNGGVRDDGSPQTDPGAGGGVVACAHFVWLRVENRPVWYVLQNVGRPTGFIEGAAAIAHWKAERAAKRSLYEPAVEQAIVALFERLGFDPYEDEDDLISTG